MSVSTEVSGPRDLTDPKQSVEAMVNGRLRAIDAGQRRLIVYAAVIVGAFFGGLGAWSVLAPIDSAVVAEGQIVVAGSRNLIQSEKGGVVSEILFRDGDRVEQGQVVLRLDNTRARAAYQQPLVRYYQALALQARLDAERDGRNEIPFPDVLIAAKSNPVVAKAINGQQKVFESRKDTLDNQVGILRQKIRESQDEIEGWRTRI